MIATLQATKAYDHLQIPTIPMRLLMAMATRQKGKLTDILAPEAQLCARAAVSLFSRPTYIRRLKHEYKLRRDLGRS